ncbi:hypothetical protein GF327_10165 [Candidatus Woesearchaeota archaeon]|nr:hypothetical protein [Candidatus Woesearchaeota archaeon]
MKLKKEVRDIKRLKRIINVFIESGFGYYFHRINLHEKILKKFSHPEKPTLKQKQDFPDKLRNSFEELGGAFIKFGQILSLRPDLVPKKYCDELSKLQDQVSLFSYDAVQKIIESELKKPVYRLFDSFNKEPIAAASIGQVHLAKLKNGKKVVVKVQRPNIKQEFESDIDLMYFIAKLIEKHYSTKIVNPSLIVKEFEEYTKKELDYMHEAQNLFTAYNNFKKTQIKIPEIVWDLTTSKVLTMEYIPGKKLNKIKTLDKQDKKILSKKITKGIYKMVFIDGFFHADPHPGNILILKDNKISFIDFGITGYINPQLKEKLTDLFIAATNKNLKKITELFLELGRADKNSIDKSNLTNDIRETFSIYYNQPLNHVKISVLLEKMISLSKKYDLKLSSNLILLSKCIITTESVVINLDPEFNPIQSAKPFVKKLIYRKYFPKRIFKEFVDQFPKIKNFIFKVPDMAQDMITGISSGEKAIENLHQDMNNLRIEMDRSSNRVSLALIITGLIIGSSFMMGYEQQRFFDIPVFSFFGFIVSFLLLLVLMVLVIREKS